MNNLDNHTVLEIIKMIDRKMSLLDLYSYEEYVGFEEKKDLMLRINVLQELSDYLQEYIEAQVSQVEQ